MAPELMEGQEYDQSVDIWSFGCLAIELAQQNLNEYLGDIEDHEKMIEKIKKHGPPKLDAKKWSPSFIDFVSKCLVIDPAQRQNAKQLMVHEFLQGAQNLQGKFVEQLEKAKELKAAS